MKICGAGMMRVADAMAKALGGESISLLLPATAMANDAAGQLGLVDPGVEELLISPVIIREISSGKSGPRRRVEFTVPASAIERELPSLGMGTAEDLFRAVLGVNLGNDLFHIERVATESFAGSVCFFVISGVE
jgi:hypothetical protein